MIILVDHHLEGYVVLLLGTIVAEGWLDLLALQFVALIDVGLPIDSNDRVIWRYIQQHKMILLTGNRRMRGPDSLEQTIREENTATALPVITIGSVDRLDERDYRTQCIRRLVEIVVDIDTYRGVGRLFIP